MENEQNGQATLPAILKSDNLLEIAEAAEKRVDALNRIKLIALRMTNARDWVDQSGKPWLQESGATKVARVFGISWKFDGDPVVERFEDGHYSYTYGATFTLADVSIGAIGTRSSKDGFFKKYDYTNPNQRVELPPSEIDVGDVKKSAMANCLARGITTILGIKNLTWEEITEHTGIRKSDATGVTYKDKGQKPGKKESGQGGVEILTENQRKRLWAITKAKKVGDDAAGDFLDWLATKEESVTINDKKKLTKKAVMALFNDNDKKFNERFIEFEKDYL